MLLSALETQSDIDVLSAPNMVTTDNEEAEIVVGRNVPFVASRATSSSNLSNLFTTIERRDVGITLRLTPPHHGRRLRAPDALRGGVRHRPDPEPGDRRPEPGRTDHHDPLRRARSWARATRQTVVIGGLLADTVRVGERGVPFLKDVPVLGNLFKHDDTERVKTNLLVFLTPHVISTRPPDGRQLAPRARAHAAADAPQPRAAWPLVGDSAGEAPDG